MRLKTFTAGSLPEAMAQVRQSLGADAVILSTQPDRGGGIRVTAALDDEAEAAPAAAGPEAPLELECLAETLDYHRVPQDLAHRLLALAGERAEATEAAALADALGSELSFAAAPAQPEGRPWLLVGPPGAGKTASAAKLATLARLAGRPAAMVTLDNGKAGGLAQIRAFAEALEVPLTEADDAEAAATAAARHGADALVLIDTLGESPFEPAAQERLAAVAEAADAAPLAVLPAGGDTLEMADSALAYAELGARHMLASKLDAARRLGGVLAAAHAGDLAFLGAGVAPTIGDGLAALDAAALARFLLVYRDEAEAPAVATGADA